MWFILALAIAGIILKLLDGLWASEPWYQAHRRWYLTAGAVLSIAIAVGTYVWQPEPVSKDDVRQVLREEFTRLFLGAEADSVVVDSLTQLARSLEKVAETTLDSGLFYLGYREHDKAKSMLGLALMASRPDSSKTAQVFFFLGVAEQLVGDVPAALSLYDSSIAYNADRHEAWYNRGVLLMQIGRRDDALASYDSTLARESKDHEAWNNKGVLLDSLGRWTEALQCINRALSLDSLDPEYWMNKGQLLLKMDSMRSAITTYRAMERRGLVTYPALLMLSIAYDKLGETGSALAVSNRAIKLPRRDQFIWFNRSLLFERQQQWGHAVECLDSGLAIKPDAPDIWARRAAYSLMAGDTLSALTSCDSAEFYGADDPISLNRIVSIRSLPLE